ncbi:GNAT family N-acetyltransferase [Longimicrobium sp.]|uniref:GNAT family N-acetyltransferase n=1 Tax=Longimicrobium sp. TaxID=2029185 RepID=UPI002E332A7D|nr:GNAT family N-acetyltransferase [Longimicrobium sp.]HEX6040243.1 GNAT family N-acetyltransferase [Longimicrobium sp.]
MQSIQIAALLPDLPRWVEVRASLLDGRGEVMGLRHRPAFSFLLREPDGSLLAVVGPADKERIRSVILTLRADAQVICAPEQGDGVAAALAGWRRTRAVLHRLRDPSRLPPAPDDGVRFLRPGELETLVDLSMDLRRELGDAEGEGQPIAAGFVEGRAVSFCYPASVTETLWDISIDTLPEFRRRGLAGRCVAHVVRHMWTMGREPVWGAVVENPASWRLARKLGFAPVDELALFRGAGETGPGLER